MAVLEHACAHAGTLAGRVGFSMAKFPAAQLSIRFATLEDPAAADTPSERAVPPARTRPTQAVTTRVEVIFSK